MKTDIIKSKDNLNLPCLIITMVGGIFLLLEKEEGRKRNIIFKALHIYGGDMEKWEMCMFDPQTGHFELYKGQVILEND